MTKHRHKIDKFIVITKYITKKVLSSYNGNTILLFRPIFFALFLLYPLLLAL